MTGVYHHRNMGIPMLWGVLVYHDRQKQTYLLWQTAVILKLWQTLAGISGTTKDQGEQTAPGHKLLCLTLAPAQVAQGLKAVTAHRWTVEPGVE